MKNFGLILLGAFIGVAICFIATLPQQNEKVLKGDNATIYYYDKNNGFFDIAIETKNGMKITTEAPMEIGDYYDGAYLTGK